MAAEQPLWTPSGEDIASANLTAFTAAAEARTGLKFGAYRDLHAWSIADRATFWDLLWDECGIIGEKGARVLVDGDRMPGAGFFPDASL